MLERKVTSFPLVEVDEIDMIKFKNEPRETEKLQNE